ncbi:MAG: DEAD/DEAH box helicase family protein [Patescibacteria group bacterium]|nr:DEAD/DEAH box helicase family protein [Patescibacteria group bacterium]MDE2116578.1 DEAD/DEAH box helicase family protein [Patescibacteria group bacterium]
MKTDRQQSQPNFNLGEFVMIQPFPYQSECRNALDAVRAQGRRNALVTMASGLGKTVTGALDAQACLPRYGGRFLYLCHQNDIINQSRATFEAVLGPGYTYGCFHGQEKRVHDRSCVFASFQTMRTSFQSFAPTDFDYILVDESHHTSALTYLRVVEYFKPKFLLGMTATPERRDGQNIHSVYGEEVYYLPLEEALARNLLTPVDYRLMTDQVKLGSNRGNLADLDISETGGPVFTQMSDSEIWAKIQENSKELADPRIIIFVETIERAEELMNVIPGSATIHSRVPIKERLVRLGLFRAGIIGTAITVDCFNEGVDVPEANVIAFLRSTSSSRIFLQQLGRGLRRCEGKSKVIVLDFVGNSERLLMLEDFSSRVANCIRRVSGLKGPDIVLNEGQTSQAETISGLKFDKKVRAVLDVVKRGRRKRVSDIPEMAEDFSNKNRLQASRILADSFKTQVWWLCAKCGCEWRSSPGVRKSTGQGCPRCAVELRDDNNLLISHPHLGKEYSSKNPISPDKVHPFSLDLVWWECSVCSYEYRARVKGRVQRGDGCPSCAARVLEHQSNLAFKHPELAAEYSHENSLSPEHVGTYSSNRWFWNCSTCGQGWWTSAGARARGRCGCPKCAVEEVERPKPTIATVAMVQAPEVPHEDSRAFIAAPPEAVRTLRIAHPDLAMEYSHRNAKPAEDVSPDLEERLWWVCSSCGRYWQATYRERMEGVQCKRCPEPVELASAS